MAKIRRRSWPVSGEFIHVAGAPVFVDVEFATQPGKVDHVWLVLDAGERVQVSVNTRSKRNLDAGFDPRVAVGRIIIDEAQLPEPGIHSHPGLDYDVIESRLNVFYEWHDRVQMESLLIEKGRAATLVEAWGEAFFRPTLGVHQIHSRHSSCAVPEHITGRDGALQFHYADGMRCEMLLFKFCGQ